MRSLVSFNSYDQLKTSLSRAKIVWFIIPVVGAVISIVCLILKKHCWTCVVSSTCGFLVVFTNVITFSGLLFIASDIYVNSMITGV